MENESKKNNIFNIEYTFLIKGIAILILLLHHLFYENINLQIGTFNLSGLVVQLTKVCVTVFTILSGYGMTKSYERSQKKNFEFVAEHIKKLIISYWWVYVPALILSFFIHRLGTPFQIYNSGIQGVKNFFIDVFAVRGVGYTQTLNESWWYMEAIIVFYLSFPFIYKCTKKFPILSMILSAIPIIAYDIFRIFPAQLINPDREIYYLLPFIIGIFMANKKVLDKVVSYCNNHHHLLLVFISIILIICFQCITIKYRMIGNIFYAISIILFGIGICFYNNSISNGLKILGKNSMNIFLVHSFYHGYFTVFRNIIVNIPTIILKYFTLLFMSLGTSIAIEKGKTKLEKNKKLKKRIFIILLLFLISIMFAIGVNGMKSWQTEKHENNQILGDKNTGSLFDPNVIIDKDGIYRMYVSWRNKKSIALSTSKDGTKWTNLQEVLSRDEKTRVGRRCQSCNGYLQRWYLSNVVYWTK